MRLHDQDRVGKWGAPESFSLSYILFHFSPIFSLRENGWNSAYRNLFDPAS